MEKKKKVRFSLTFIIVGSIFLILLLFGIILSVIGYVSFTDTLKREYKETTHHIAVTSRSLIEADNIEKYLNNEEMDDYELRRGYLKNFCNYMDVTLIHCYKLNQSNYLDAVNIFNVVNDKEIKPRGPYDEWELGREFGEIYTKNFKDICEKLYTKKASEGVVYRTTNLKGKAPHITTLIPILDSSDNVIAVLTVQRPMSELVNGRKPYIMTIGFTTLGLMVFLSLFAFFNMKFRVLKPIKDVIEETKYFSKENKKSKELKKKDYRIKEIDELKVAVDKMEDDMTNYIRNLTKVTSEKEKISAELDIASQIQNNSVPNVFPAFPDRTDFDIYAYMRPAKEVGGDFYNFFLIDETHLAMVMADVSGKGIPASLFMMVSNILLSEALRIGTTPKDALRFINNRICERNPLNMFVTIWVGVLNLETGEVIASNAGHDDPLVLSNGGYDFKKSSHGIIVGAMSDMEYVNYEFKLNKGDKIFLYTDGVPEATDRNNKMYGLNKLQDLLNCNRNKNCKETIDVVLDSVERFVGEAPQFDDITMLVIEYKGN